jgi:hypothetical protein
MCCKTHFDSFEIKFAAENPLYFQQSQPFEIAQQSLQPDIFQDCEMFDLSTIVYKERIVVKCFLQFQIPNIANVFLCIYAFPKFLII